MNPTLNVQLLQNGKYGCRCFLLLLALLRCLRYITNGNWSKRTIFTTTLISLRTKNEHFVGEGISMPVEVLVCHARNVSVASTNESKSKVRGALVMEGARKRAQRTNTNTQSGKR